MTGIFVKKIWFVYSKEEIKILTENFWAGFTMFCSHLDYLSGRDKKWILHRTKVKNVHLKFEPGRDAIRVILEIMHRDETKRLEQFEKIERYKIVLEEGFENGLIWDFAYRRENGQEVCRMYAEKKGLDWHRQSQWEEIYKFMAENMFRLENNFLDIRELIN